MRFWKILRGLQTVGQNLKAGPVLKFAFFEYENFQRYRQFCLLTGLKFALNYQNKILFLLRWGRILFKVKIKILKNLSPLKTVILNFIADIFLTVFVRSLTRQKRPWIHASYLILVLAKKQARKNLDKILSLKMRKLVSRYANKV